MSEFGFGCFAGALIAGVAWAALDPAQLWLERMRRESALIEAKILRDRVVELLKANSAYLQRARAERARADRLENAVLAAGFRSMDDDTKIARTTAATPRPTR